MTVLSQKLARIRLIVSDVDGTLTDGRIFVSSEGHISKAYTVRDGLASNIWVRTGGLFAILTGRPECKSVSVRAREMKAHRTVFNSSNKEEDFLKLCQELEIPASEAAFLGDDLIDLPAMRHSGLSVAVADAAPEVMQSVDLVLTTPGGMGALRELVTQIMTARGDWHTAIERFTR